MQSDSVVLEGYNLWFTIELISFYAYIGAAILFIFERSLISNLGLINKKTIADCYKYDFINYHEKELNWMAFIFIMFLVNLLICYFSDMRIDS